MKKLKRTLLLLTVIISIPINNLFASERNFKIEAVFGQTKFSLNGSPLKQDSLLYNGIAYLPASYIAKTLGLNTHWDSVTNTTTLSYSFSPSKVQEDQDLSSKVPTKKTIDVVFGATKYILNGEELAQESLLYNGTAYLPASFLASQLGLNAKWNQQTNVTDIELIEVSNVSFDNREIAINKGENSNQLNPIITPSDATVKVLQYKSSDPNIVQVNSDGTLIGKSSGTAEITATSINGKQTTCKVNVIVPVTHLVIKLDKSKIKLGDSTSFTVSVFPEDATDKSYDLKYDGSIVQLSDSTFYSKSGGVVAITAQAKNGINTTSNLQVVDLQAFANDVLTLTNNERIEAGLSPLSGSDNNLNNCAMFRATELITKYSHDRPDGSSCFTAYEEFGVQFRTAGENIAMGYVSPSDVVQGWMNSPGHRANILNSSFSALGAGVDMDENGKLYWSQNFK